MIGPLANEHRIPALEGLLAEAASRGVEITAGTAEVPFGGVRDSGYGTVGRSEAIEAYLVTNYMTELAA